MRINDYIMKIKKLNACGDAVKDALNYETSEALWNDCKRGNWMLWLLRRVLILEDESVLRRFTLAKVRCAKLVIHLMKDERSRKAVEVAENFGLGTASREELDAAAADAADADAAADAAYTAYTAYAAYAAAAAAADAASAADADAAADAAAAAAADADAYAAAAAAARNKTLADCANIVRELYPSIEDLLN